MVQLVKMTIYTNNTENIYSNNRKFIRVAIFANYDADNVIQNYVVYYLKKLKKVADKIIFVSDCTYSQKELKKVSKYVYHKICEKHGEYDFGSYKRGFIYAKENGLLDNCEELILCNDSCYAPIHPFEDMFNAMSNRKNIDFWGITMNPVGYIEIGDDEYKGDSDIPHIQSYFVVLKQKVIHSAIFEKFMFSIKKEKIKNAIIYKYEEGLTKELEKNGYKWDVFCQSSKILKNSQVCYFKNLIKEDFSPCLKTSICRYQNKNLNIYPDDIYSYIQKQTQYDISLIYKDLKNKKIIKDKTIRRFIVNTESQMPYFSIIMPTYNRAFCIENAINSLLNQTYTNWELVIIDDGSTDNTRNLIKNKYKNYLKNRKIKYKRIKHKGVSQARNIALKLCKNKWIGYLDSDNSLLPDFLKIFADAIMKKNKSMCFYAKTENSAGEIIGQKYDFKQLCIANYIDLGAFVHNKLLIKKYGNFDVNLKRLVDWDLIIRYTRHNKPYFINKVLYKYNIDNKFERISNTENLEIAQNYISKKIKKYREKEPILSKIFSIKNSGIRKVITVFGLKFKFKSKKLIKRKQITDIVNELKKVNKKIKKIKKDVEKLEKTIFVNTADF
jgi:glycosyltransferase involved in cell wall biosynthesis